jgi:hypothetical protein
MRTIVTIAALSTAAIPACLLSQEGASPASRDSTLAEVLVASPAPSDPILAEVLAASAAPSDPTLAEVLAATERFRDVQVALAEGYVPDPMNICETAEHMGRPAADGVMGIHYSRPDLLGITGPPDPRVTGTGTHTDFRRPGVLIYEPQADGSLALVAIENLVFIEAWEAAGNRQPPSFRGVAYDRMVDDPATPVDEAHMFAPHYDLHMWLYRDNPRGMFAQLNPNATCRHHRGGAHGH